MGVISYIKEEIKVVKERDPAIKSDIEVLLYPSFKVMLHYRIAHKLYLKKHYFLEMSVNYSSCIGDFSLYHHFNFLNFLYFFTLTK